MNLPGKQPKLIQYEEQAQTLPTSSEVTSVRPSKEPRSVWDAANICVLRLQGFSVFAAVVPGQGSDVTGVSL